MLRHGEGIGYTGPGSRMGPTDNFSLVTGPDVHSVIVQDGPKTVTVHWSDGSLERKVWNGVFASTMDRNFSVGPRTHYDVNFTIIIIILRCRGD